MESDNYLGIYSEVNEAINACKINDSGDCLNISPLEESFFVFLGGTMASNKMLASAYYAKEDVCLCITKDYKFVLTQDDSGCGGNDTTRDYSKILGIPDVSGDDDYGCYCC